ncbi:bifunctional adenosylcobinamide kinase/adenosylcobinamide-phosphate guanylyltransferase [Mediterraneibacter glycyrrhizinilyticus]|uniref:bifunctional adenosylcobinamide kinase/adenosylcobinamide-phosphate guanylyltransferase n=1 Tax=Mediterraneibacter glycyrrhizinilyticus TaxID=342942 RepID=UPI00195FB336|nr:bifunctional adenosylcobinamide kinase/adenosylcobinamide-phosphate guanylyltransferase [Mediterraneibacter glycyrrhizinilyticus]
MMELVTGGSGSGKSAYAESVICGKHRLLCETTENAPLYYIADMVPYGRETEKKIEAHRKMRAGKGFATLEWYVDLPGKISAPDSPELKGSCVLLECVSNLTANEMYEPAGAQNTGGDTPESVIKGVRMLKERCAHLVVVTNDVFRESVTDSEEMTAYKGNLGMINRALAEMADQVTEVVFGVPVCIKSGSDMADGTGKQMKFITGGAYQGKLEYAKKLYPGAEWTDGAGCSLQEILSCGAVDHFHLFVRRWLQEGKTPQELIRAILDKNRDLIIVCDEIGCGLVPTDAFEREYRESVGRICTQLVEYADEVYRVTCGIGGRLR